MTVQGLFCVVAFLAFLLQGCGTSSSTNRLSSALGVVGLASPTAPDTASSSVILKSNKFLVDSSLNPIRLFGKHRPFSETTDAPQLADIKSDITDTLNETTASACVTGAFTFTPNVTNPSCYGPKLYYQNHPDGADGSPAGADTYPSLPNGDLGLWTAAESSGEACASAKMNSVVKNVSDVVNSAVKSMAAVLCVMNVNKKSLPTTEGGSVEIPSELTAAISGSSFTVAKLELLAARSGAVKTYKLTVTGTLAGSKPVDLTLIHSPTMADNSTFAGHFHGIVQGGANPTAFSMTYNQDATKLNAVLRTGDMTASSDTAFDGSDDLDYSQATFSGKSVYYNLMSLTSSTGLGTIYSAWQANPVDDSSRVFQAQTTAATTDTGVAYFGFGPQITNATNRGKITKMVCNWAGPSNAHAGSAKAQKQIISRSPTTGYFTATTNLITYAPANSCDNGVNTFAVSTSGAPAALGTVTNNLVATSDITSNIDTLTEPTY